MYEPLTGLGAGELFVLVGATLRDQLVVRETLAQGPGSATQFVAPP